MANRIKGITIEIGGDTTKLDKALSGTNKHLKNTQSSLRDVERLLKLDPGNTELLLQKQRLLSEAAEASRQKLETLRSAAANADAALERKVNFDAKYQPLQNQITSVSATLDGLRDNQAQMEQDLASGKISTDTYDSFQTKVKETEQTLESLKQQQKAVEEEFSGAKMDQSQYDALQRELIETEREYKEAEKAAASFSQTAEKVGTAASKVAEGAGEVANATKGLSTAAAGGVAAFGLLAVNAGKAADDLNTLSKQSGFSTDDLQKWQYAADLVDVSVDDIIGAARKMKKNMVSESAETQAAFAKLGVSVYDGTDQLRDATDVFYQLLESLSYVPNETERDILAMQIFGKSADDLAGIIDDGGEALRQLGKEAEDAGLILSKDALDGANAFNDGLDRLKAQAQATFLESGAELAENLLPVMEAAVEAASSLFQWFASLDGSTLKLLMGVLLAVAAISPVASTISTIANAVSAISGLAGSLSGAASALSGISTAIGGIGTAASGASSAVSSFLLGPAGLVVAAAAAVGALVYLYETNETFRQSLENFDQWITGIFTTDWTESFGAAGEVLNALFASGLEVYEGFKQILGGVVDLVAGAFTGDWERAWQGVIDIFGGVFSTLEAVAKAPVNSLIGMVNSLILSVCDGINSVIEMLNEISVDIPNWVPGLGGKKLGFNISTVTAPQIPYLAEGTVTRPNSPFMAVVGDNPTEPEIIAPYSTVKQATMEAIAETGGTGGGAKVLYATFYLDGRQFAHTLVPLLNSETQRVGISLTTKNG